MNVHDLDRPGCDARPSHVADRSALPMRPVREEYEGASSAASATEADPGFGDDAARVLGVRFGSEFRCEALSCILTVAACAARHERAVRDARIVHPRALTTLHGSPCLRCSIGIEHARRGCQ